MRKSAYILVFVIFLFTMVNAETTFIGNTDIANGTYNLKFKLYSSNTSEYDIWSEIHNDVIVNDGSYSVVLGSINPFISIDSEMKYFIEVFRDGISIGERREINLASEIEGFAREIETPDSSSGVTLEELTPSLEIGNGTDDVIVVDGSDFGIGLAVGADATGRLEVRGDEVRVWDGSASVGYANGEGDVFIEDQLEVDNTIYASHYRDNGGGLLVNAESGSPISVSEDSDGSYTIGLDVGGVPTNILVLDQPCGGSPWTSPYADALDVLGWTYTEATGVDNFYTLLTNGTDWGLAILNIYADTPPVATYQALADELTSGDAVIYNEWTGSRTGTGIEALRTAMGIATAPMITYSYPAPLYAWDTSHELYTTPNTIASSFSTTGDYCGSERHLMTVTTGTAVAGFTASPTAGQAAVVAAPSGRGIIMSEVTFVFTPAVMLDFLVNQISFVCNLSGTSFNDDDWTGAGTGTMSPVNASDNIGLGTTSATGRLDVRGNEVRIWDGSASVGYANGAGDLFVEDQLEVDNMIYASHYRDNTGGSLINIASGTPLTVTEDADGSYTIASGGGVQTWTFDAGLDGWTVSNPCSYPATWSLVTDSGRNVVKANYNYANTSSMLLSPVVSISGGTVNLEYIHRWATESCCDEAFVKYRLDGGAWQHFTPTIGSYSGSHSCDYDPTNGCSSRTQTSYYSTGGYATHSGDISAGTASTIQFAMAITSDGSVTSTGWWIDEVTLTGGGSGSTADDDWTGAGTGTMTASNTTDNVGIGTASAIGKLDVRGDEVRIWDGSATLDYVSAAGDLYVEDVLEVDNAVYAPRYIDSNSGGFYVDPAGTSRLSVVDLGYIYNSGTVYSGGVAINDNLVPAGYTFDLGNGTSYDWDDLWLSGMIYLDGSAGSSGQVLTTNGSGDVYWSTAGGGSEWYDGGTYLRTNESGESIRPYSSNTADLGMSGYYWRYAYVGRYYDGNNTSYYIDPASTSILNTTDQRSYMTNTGSSYGGGVAIHDNLVPTSTMYDLGNGSSYDWDDLWLSGMIYLDGSAGTSGQVLKTNGSGDVYWGADETGGSSGSWCTGDQIFGTGTATSRYYPWYSYYNYSRSSSLILRSELSGCEGGFISAISVYVGSSGSHNFTGLRIYMQETSLTSLTSTTWSPGTQVNYTSSKTFNTTGWHTFTLSPQFDWDANNLQVSFQHGYTSYTTSYPYFRNTTQTATMQRYGYSDSSLPSLTSGTTARANIRLTFTGSSLFREREVEIGAPYIDVSSMGFDCGYIELLDEEIRIPYGAAFSDELGCRTPIVLATALEPGKDLYISEIDQTGFTVHCDNPEGAKFNWSAMIKPVSDAEALYRVESSEEYNELKMELLENPSAHSYDEWNSLFKALGAECAPIKYDNYKARVFSTSDGISDEK